MPQCSSDNQLTGQPNRVMLYFSLTFFFVAFILLRYGAVERLYTSSQHDVRAYLACAHNILNDRNIYTTHHQLIPEDETLTRDVPKYTYPPLWGMLMIPATVVPYDTFKHIWFFANLFFVFSGIMLLCWFLPFSRDGAVTAFFLVSAAAVGSDWILWLLRTAQADAFFALVIVLAFILFEKQKWLGAAILVSIASWSKVTPGIIFLYFLARGNWRYFFYATGAGLGLMFVQLAAVGSDVMLFYFTDVLPERVASPFPVPSMQSLWSLNQLLFVPCRRYSVFDAPEIFDSALFWSQVAVAIVISAMLLRDTKERWGRFYGFAACAAASLLVTNSSWMMRYSWSVIVLMAALAALLRARHLWSRLAIGMLTGLGLLSHLRFAIDAFYPKKEGLEFLLLGAPGFMTVVLTFFLAAVVIKEGDWAPFVKWPVQKAKTLLQSNSKVTAKTVRNAMPGGPTPTASHPNA